MVVRIRLPVYSFQLCVKTPKYQNVCFLLLLLLKIVYYYKCTLPLLSILLHVLNCCYILRTASFTVMFQLRIFLLFCSIYNLLRKQSKSR
ncbi:hypothetical protein J3Q64DRAFT_1744144, partial [Phycomyces blakesleeanus]